MKTTIEARTLYSGQIEPRHEVELVCAACGYNLTESELNADICADCNEPLNLKQHISIHATSIPAAGGGVM
jgi:hypothetical protein